ncbi:MAG TPA: hypothetical protein VN826_06470, partial [Candidatus Eisenbacteria bacterium]|nr:hypothetical protein [Candidatus Eisenbacteria bacterium]
SSWINFTFLGQVDSLYTNSFLPSMKFLLSHSHSDTKTLLGVFTQSGGSEASRFLGEVQMWDSSA